MNKKGSGMEFTGVEEIDELFDSPLLTIWALFSFAAGIVLLILSIAGGNFAQMAFFFFPLIFLLIIALKRPDWAEREDPNAVLSWTLLGLGGVLAIGAFFSFVAAAEGRYVWAPAEWTPMRLLQTIPGGEAKLPLLSVWFVDFFATGFLVAPGEQAFQASFFPLFNLEPLNWLDRLPFALNPPVFGGVGIWALCHIIIGQYVTWYVIPVFLSGLVMAEAAYRSGTWFTSVLIHAINNWIAIMASMAMMGG
ncbi:MAG: CPBP family glutamic-type intramembrane protease [Candidatus Bathyarchaeia archaeon]